LFKVYPKGSACNNKTFLGHWKKRTDWNLSSNFFAIVFLNRNKLSVQVDYITLVGLQYGEVLHKCAIISHTKGEGNTTMPHIFAFLPVKW